MGNKKKYININNFGFNFLNSANIKNLLFYYPVKHNDYHEWVFFYNKTSKFVAVDYVEYYKLNTNIKFEDFIKPFNFEYNWIKDFK